MLDRMRSGRQGIGAAALAGLLFAWLSLLCGHCLALGVSAGAQAEAACPHAQAQHDDCGGGCEPCCHPAGEMQGMPPTELDALLPPAADPQPVPVAASAGSFVLVSADALIRDGPPREQALWKAPPLFLLHRVLRD